MILTPKVPALVKAVMTHLLRCSQGGQPLTEARSHAESLLKAGEHPDQVLTCARSHLALPGRLVFALPSSAFAARAADWSNMTLLHLALLLGGRDGAPAVSDVRKHLSCFCTSSG